MPAGIYPHKRGYKRAKEIGEKISKALTGRKLSEEHREKMREIKKKNPVRYWLGKKRPSPSKETKNKMRETALRNGNKPPVMRGENNPKWKGGNSRYYKEGYWSKEYLQWRKAVFERDNYTCQVCRKVGIYLTAHHIKSWACYPKLRFNINNGVTLCEECHKLTDNYKGRNKKTIKKEND